MVFKDHVRLKYFFFSFSFVDRLLFPELIRFCRQSTSALPLIVLTRRFLWSSPLCVPKVQIPSQKLIYYTTVGCGAFDRARIFLNENGKDGLRRAKTGLFINFWFSSHGYRYAKTVEG